MLSVPSSRAACVPETSPDVETMKTERRAVGAGLGLLWWNLVGGGPHYGPREEGGPPFALVSA